MSQRGSTWRQLEASMDLKIIEKPLFFPRFFRCFEEIRGILQERLGEAFGNALGDLRDALGGLGGTLGTPWGRPWGRLGEPSGRTLQKPWRNLLQRPPRRATRLREAEDPPRLQLRITY